MVININLRRFSSRKGSSPAPTPGHSLIDHGKSPLDANSRSPLPPAEPRVSALADLGKVAMPEDSTASASPAGSRRASASMIDWGKAPPSADSRPPMPQEKTAASSLIDFGKEPGHEKSLLAALKIPPRAPVSLIDLGKSHEREQPVETLPLSRTARIMLGVGCAASMGLVVLLVTLFRTAATPTKPRVFEPVSLAARPVDEFDLAAGSGSALRLTQLWNDYQARLREIAPGSDADSPWWQIATAAKLPAEKAQAVRALQGDTLAKFDQLQASVSDAASGSLALVLSAKKRLESQQTPPPANKDTAPRENLGGFSIQ